MIRVQVLDETTLTNHCNTSHSVGVEYIYLSVADNHPLPPPKKTDLAQRKGILASKKSKSHAEPIQGKKQV